MSEILNSTEKSALRRHITEGLRIQRGGAKSIDYIDVASALSDIKARQNHVVFARRGCGKTLLLHAAQEAAEPDVRCVYLNCEDFKRHSFPNVLLEILDALFSELEKALSGWFGRKRRCKQIIADVRADVKRLRARADERNATVKETSKSERAVSVGADLSYEQIGVNAEAGAQNRNTLELEYKTHDSKVSDLDLALPDLKAKIRELFELSSKVKTLMIQLDDFYHLRRADQAHVIDYVHRLCKDVPLYFKVATLRHASALYADRDGQPTGVQERHDYQPLNVDFNLGSLNQTVSQIEQISLEYARRAKIEPERFRSLFRGDGFERLVLAGGGVPRDCLSLLLEATKNDGATEGDDGRIGKDDVRALAKSNIERRIEELKQDSQVADQGPLIRGTHAIRKFCLERKTSAFVIGESVLQSNDRVRWMVNRLLDYRLVHHVASAISHKSAGGAYQGYVIDLGCYAHLRKLHNRLTELDLGDREWRERIRSVPVLEEDVLGTLFDAAPPAREAEAELKMPTDSDS